MTYPGTLLRESQIFAKKELGQNFLTNPKVAEQIVNLAQISKNDVVIEIGAGLGALTIPVAKKAAKVYAVEKDNRLIQLLCNEIGVAGVNNVHVVHKDILKLDIEEMANTDQIRKKFIVIGNLPYNISSQVLFRLVEKRAFISRAILMFQKELAQRICASPGGRDYGRLSAVMQYCSTVKTLIDVGANLFFPKPNIESIVIEVNFFERASCTDDSSKADSSKADSSKADSSKADSSEVDSSEADSSEVDYNLSSAQEKFLFNVIKAAFSKRRKTLRNSLSGSELEIDRVQTEKGLQLAGIDPERRAETLEVKEFISLARALWSILTGINDSYGH